MHYTLLFKVSTFDHVMWGSVPHMLSLLVMGMDHYGSVKVWDVIQEKLMPMKTPKQLQLRVKNASANRTGDNVIKVLHSELCSL